METPSLALITTDMSDLNSALMVAAIAVLATVVAVVKAWGDRKVQEIRGELRETRHVIVRGQRAATRRAGEEENKEENDA